MRRIPPHWQVPLPDDSTLDDIAHFVSDGGKAYVAAFLLEFIPEGKKLYLFRTFRLISFFPILVLKFLIPLLTPAQIPLPIYAYHCG